MDRNKILDSNFIKMIAIIAMTIDHVTWMMYPGYSYEPMPIVLHIIGRLTCPIMCYFIAEGFHYTRNVNKYTLRLFIFAFISHFAYMFASSSFVDWKSFIPFYYGSVSNQTSVMWSLAWGLVMLRVVYSDKIKSNVLKVILIILICVITFPSNWSCVAALVILAFGTNRGKFRAQMLWMVFYVAIYAAVYFFANDKIYGIIQMGVVLVIPILMLYNGKRGHNASLNKVMKWLFYVYYPLHLAVIGVIRYLGLPTADMKDFFNASIWWVITGIVVALVLAGIGQAKRNAIDDMK